MSASRSSSEITRNLSCHVPWFCFTWCWPCSQPGALFMVARWPQKYQVDILQLSHSASFPNFHQSTRIHYDEPGPGHVLLPIGQTRVTCFPLKWSECWDPSLLPLVFPVSPISSWSSSLSSSFTTTPHSAPGKEMATSSKGSFLTDSGLSVGVGSKTGSRDASSDKGRQCGVWEEFSSYASIMIKSGCLAEDGKAESSLRGKGCHDWLIMSARSTGVGNGCGQAMYLPSLIKETAWIVVQWLIATVSSFTQWGHLSRTASENNCWRRCTRGADHVVP